MADSDPSLSAIFLQWSLPFAVAQDRDFSHGTRVAGIGMQTSGGADGSALASLEKYFLVLHRNPQLLALRCLLPALVK